MEKENETANSICCMVDSVRALLALGAAGDNSFSVRLAVIITLATHRHHGGGRVCPAARSPVPASSAAFIWENLARMNQRPNLGLSFTVPGGTHLAEA